MPFASLDHTMVKLRGVPFLVPRTVYAWVHDFFVIPKPHQPYVDIVIECECNLEIVLLRLSIVHATRSVCGFRPVRHRVHLGNGVKG